ncbi:polysaccharide pyruvyl transferase family protein [Antarcticibacterium flavum]|uniref:Polysaccharide pyruvyl transferase family protein n=1 Tax=Antarcticibacterium flavum TaxID=2058175 RepID=A0A5B7X726_9FLAO|nr:MULTISPECIES: polysaccharide pyruvyl transferase family protein [Antarcticibacterium]MCM4159362.1 hypothetical protein [Antarcticibacterium sp. W02-3]QCY70935.1 polysaccharide pyruvyl transferase family protein [Antarcticibacterium flavum]
MKIIPFVKNLLTSPARSLRKIEVKNGLINSPQFNREIANVYRMDIDNAGDYYSSPVHYFKELGDIQVDIFDFKNSADTNLEEQISNNALIIGGGGLLNRKSFKFQMKTFEALAGRGKKTVLWGVGHNSKNKKDFRKLESYNIKTEKFGLAGTRDYSLSKEWVPCVSCLNEVFDKSYSAIRETGIILHKKTLKNSRIAAAFKDYPLISNSQDLEQFVEFIGTSENIITDSYHAMYWGILLNKKVVVVPNSSKFFDFKYAPVISSFENCIEDLKKAEVIDGVLEECRERNRLFAEKVFNYLEI